MTTLTETKSDSSTSILSYTFDYSRILGMAHVYQAIEKRMERQELLVVTRKENEGKEQAIRNLKDKIAKLTNQLKNIEIIKELK